MSYLMQWKSVGKTPIYELNKFRSQLGIGVNEYIEWKHLRDVLSNK
jgi:hypothetical protein